MMNILRWVAFAGPSLWLSAVIQVCLEGNFTHWVWFKKYLEIEQLIRVYPKGVESCIFHVFLSTSVLVATVIVIYQGVMKFSTELHQDTHLWKWQFKKICMVLVHWHEIYGVVLRDTTDGWMQGMQPSTVSEHGVNFITWTKNIRV